MDSVRVDAFPDLLGDEPEIMGLERLDAIDNFDPRARIGLGLAAVGRPAYINLGRARDLPGDRSRSVLRQRAHDLLDAAYANGVRYVDVARSYGRAEEFLASWLDRHPGASDVVVGSKWGYTYTAGWRVDADVHEVKDHGITTFDRQLMESRGLLKDHLDLYQVHSVTPGSAALTDPALHRRLARLAAEGVTIGLSTSGPAQAEAIYTALGVEVDGEPLFRSVQATYNLLETSAAPALAEAHDAGRTVIVKEALANGRLAGSTARDLPVLDGLARDWGLSADAIALASVLHQPWVRLVLSGAATTEQLTNNLQGATLRLDAGQQAALRTLTEAPDAYWRSRSRLPWS